MSSLWARINRAKMEKVSLEDQRDSETLLEKWPGSSSEQDINFRLREYQYHKRQIYRYKLALSITVILLLITNLVWWWEREIYREAVLARANRHSTSSPKDITYFLEDGEPELVLRSFNHDWRDLELASELGPDGKYIYRYGDEFWGHNKWVPGHGSNVAVSAKFVKENNLLPTPALKENGSEFHYQVAGYHQLHCLAEARDALYYINGTMDWPYPYPFQWDHIIHCVEAVRQALHCNLDSTLIPVDSYWPGIANGQMHVCKNADALYRWTTEHGHAQADFDKQVEPAHTEEWYERTKGIAKSWAPDPHGLPLGKPILPQDIRAGDLYSV